MRIGTAASQFCDWPLHFSDCQATTRVAVDVEGCELCWWEQQERAGLVELAASRFSQHECAGLI
jgi:hypothetical protein